MDIFKRSGRRKSGSLQLSINAIVILVMAMVVLGLGLTFIRGLFNKGTQNLGKVLDNSQLENPANPQNPLTVDQTVTASAGDEVKLRVGFYNKWNTHTYSVEGSGEQGGVLCEGPGQENSLSLTIASPSTTVSSGEAVGLQTVLEVPEENVYTGTYVCTIRIWEGGNSGDVLSKQFFLEVVG